MIFVYFALKYSDTYSSQWKDFSIVYKFCPALGDFHFLPLDGANKVQKAEPDSAVF